MIRLLLLMVFLVAELPLPCIYGNNIVSYDTKNHNNIICYYIFDSSLINLPLSMCTCVNIAFFEVDSYYNISVSSQNIEILSNILSQRQENNPKFLISIGGADGSTLGSMISSHKNRKVFIRNVVQFLKMYKLDGIDIDWEWPVINGGQKEKVKFVQLLQEFRKEFDRHEKKYYLSVAVAALQSLIDTCYYPEHMAESVDYVNVMAYDYHFFTKLLPMTDYNSPLYTSDDDAGFFHTYNVNFTVHYWTKLGMPASKIMLGLPFYGHTYSLRSSANHGRHAPASGFGFSKRSNGFATFNEICDFLQDPSTAYVIDVHTAVPYGYNSQYWTSFDDARSLQKKVTFAMLSGLGGVMVYSLNEDDYSGSCSLYKNQSFPLLKAVNDAANNFLKFMHYKYS